MTEEEKINAIRQVAALSFGNAKKWLEAYPNESVDQITERIKKEIEKNRTIWFKQVDQFVAGSVDIDKYIYDKK